MSRIISLAAENVKRLTAVHITPKGNLVLIGGKNGAGKTSVLDSISWALGGAKEVQEQPIRAGQDRAHVVLETEDLVISRTFTAAGSTLTIKNRDGFAASKPQEMLDKLTGKLMFDPVAFLRLDAAKQRDALKRLIPVDFAEDDANRSRLAMERTLAGRKLEDAVAVLHSLPTHPNTPEAEISVAETVAELEAAQAKNQAAKDLADTAQQAQGDILDAQMELDRNDRGIADYEAELVRIQKLIEELRIVRLKKQTVVDDARAAAEKAAKVASEAQLVDVAPIRQKLAGAEAVNAHVRANARKAEQQKLVETQNQVVKDLTAAIDHIDAEKKRKLKEAKFPVDGLSFDDRGVTFNGLPFAQASQAEQLRVSVAMAVALNPKLRVMLVRDASLMDEDSLALLEKLATEHDVQVWAERVGKADKTAVIIEDGAVLATAGSEAA